MTSAKNQNKTTETVVETPKAAPVPKLHAVKLLKNYRPEGEFKMLKLKDEEDPDSPWVEYDPDGTPEMLDEKGKISVVASGDMHKVWENSCIMLPVAEAKRAFKLGIAAPHSVI